MKKILIQVTLLSDGSRTVAQATGAPPYDMACRGLGSSGREPGDRPDEAIGEKLATARALHSMARRLERQAMGRMRHNESVQNHRDEIAVRKLADQCDPLPLPCFAHDEAERYRQQQFPEEAARYPEQSALELAAAKCGCNVPRLHNTELARRAVSTARPAGRHRKHAKD